MKRVQTADRGTLWGGFSHSRNREISRVNSGPIANPPFEISADGLDIDVS
jgi:hypothetical protein